MVGRRHRRTSMWNGFTHLAWQKNQAHENKDLQAQDIKKTQEGWWKEKKLIENTQLPSDDDGKWIGED